MSAAGITHAYPYRVRYADTDTMHYMYNGQYLTLFEIGRTELLRSIGLPYVEIERSGYLLPVLEAHVFYRQPAFYDDDLTIVARMEPLSRATIILSYRILRGDTLIAEGSTSHCFVLADSRAVSRPPAFFLEALRKAESKSN